VTRSGRIADCRRGPHGRHTNPGASFLSPSPFRQMRTAHKKIRKRRNVDGFSVAFTGVVAGRSAVISSFLRRPSQVIVDRSSCCAFAFQDVDHASAMKMIAVGLFRRPGGRGVWRSAQSQTCRSRPLYCRPPIHIAFLCPKNYVRATAQVEHVSWTIGITSKQSATVMTTAT
jgi:hypothetical protein